jgi:hypothetical protein
MSFELCEEFDKFNLMIVAIAEVMEMEVDSICHIVKFLFRNVNHFSHKKLKISKRIHLF